MNMISTGAFLNEMDASNKQLTVAEKFAAVWEKKNAKAARAGGVSLMALSLAACGSSSTTTTSSSTTTTTTTATDAAKNLVFTKDVIDTLVGGSGDDTFKGDSNTATAADSVDGGSGDDTVTLVGSTTLPEMTNVETVELKSFTSAALDFTPNELSGVKNIILDTFTVAGDDLTLEAGQSLKVDDATGAAAAIEIKGDTWTTGTVTVSDSGSATHSIDLDFNSTKTTSVTIVEAGSDATSYVDIVNTGAKLKTVTVNSSYKLTMDDVAVATTIDASGSTGTLAVTSSVNKVAYTGGSGADTFTFGIADGTGKELTAKLGAGDDKLAITNINNSTDFTNSKSTMDGGDGTDTFSGDDALISELGALTAANYAKIGITGFEKVEIATAHASAGAYNLANFGVQHLIMTTDSTGAATVSGISSGATIETGKSVVALGGATTSANDFAVSLTDKAGAGDTITFDINNTTGAGAFGIDVTEIEVVTIDASGSDQTNVVEIDGLNMTKLILTTGTGNLDVDLSSTNNAGLAVAEVDATGSVSTGGIIFKADASNTVGITIKGGSGGDNITGGDYSDVITLGSGDDTVDAGVGAANTVDMTSGGDDILTLSSRTGKVTVTGFEDGDTIDIANAAVNGAEVSHTTQIASAYNGGGDEYVIYSGVNASTHSATTTGTQKIADFTDMTDVAAWIEEALDIGSNENNVVVVNDGTSSYIYDINESTTNATTVDAAEVTLIAVVDEVLVAADLFT